MAPGDKVYYWDVSANGHAVVNGPACVTKVGHKWITAVTANGAKFRVLLSDVSLVEAKSQP